MRPRRRHRSLLLLGVLALLAACTTYELVPAGRTTVRNSIVVESGQAWSRVTFVRAPGPIEAWTLNGPAIDTLTFYTAIADGEPLRRRGSGSDPFPPFRATMSASEIVELYEATLRRVTNSALVEITNLRPATLGGISGFRADTIYITPDRVRRKGVLAGVVKHSKLYLMHFQAPELHYYDRTIDEVERIFVSAKIL